MSQNSSEGKKLYWFHPHFYNWMGGHKFVYEVIARLKNQYKLEVTLVTDGLTPAAAAKFETIDVPIIKLSGISTNNVLYWLFLPLFLWTGYFYLKFVKKIDLKSGFISSMFPSNALVRMLSPNSAQLCYEPFAFFYDQNFLNGFPFPYRVFAKFTKFLYQGLDAESVRSNKVIFTLSEYNRHWIKEAYNCDSQVIYEGVDVDFFKHHVGQDLKTKYKNYHVIFHATDYTPIKGTLFLIRALPEIITTIPNIRLVISETLPDSPLKGEVTALIHELKVDKYVEMAGFLPYELLPQYLSLAKVVVQPSIQQSMNLTVKEAMACNTPVITSPEGQEQTRDGEAGFLVDPHQTSILAAQTIRCVTDSKLRKKLGQKGREIVMERFSWDGVTNKLYKAINSNLYD